MSGEGKSQVGLIIPIYYLITPEFLKETWRQMNHCQIDVASGIHSNLDTSVTLAAVENPNRN